MTDMSEMPEPTNQEPLAVKKHKRSSAWLPLILILVGVVLLVQNLTKSQFVFNWWAVFIFIPVFASLNSVWKEYQDGGWINASVRSKLGSAILIGTIGVMLMFGMDWSRFWPLLVIATGTSMFLSGLSFVDPNENSRMSVWSGMSAWVGIGAIVLGIGFLAQYLPIASIQPLLAAYPNWWAVPILLAGVGILINTVVFTGRSDWQLNWQAWTMLLITIFVIAIAVLAWFGLDWNLMFPVVLIACGFMILVGIFRKR